MESQEVLKGDRICNGNVDGPNGYGLEQVGCGENGSEDLGDELLVNLESYLDDINDRLMISRMVSDSVIKGMVNAVEQEAAKKIAAKELEVTNLKEFLQFHHVGSDKFKSLGSPLEQNELGSTNCGRYMSLQKVYVKHDKMMDSLRDRKNVAREQLKRLKKEIDAARGSLVKRIGSGSEMVGLGGILQDKGCESWVDVDRTLDSLKVTVDNICSQANAMLRLSKSSLCEWQWERDLQRELEGMVMQSSIQSIQEGFEKKLWDQSAQLLGSQSANWIHMINQISNLREELDEIFKSFSCTENGQLISHGSHDADLFHRKVLSNHVTSSSLWEGNGKLEPSKTGVPESFDAAQLKHLSKDDLVAYFNTMITKMRRDHESTVQQLTEDYFSLKREYLKERGSSLPNKKDKEFDMLKKKIPEVILKLDDIMLENEKLPTITKDPESFSSLKDRVDNLLSENHQLRDSLRIKKNEFNSLSSQLSDAYEKMLQYSEAEANMSKLIGKLKSDFQDEHIQEAINQDVFKSILHELIGDFRCDTEELAMKTLEQQIYDIILNGVAANTETITELKIEDSDAETFITQGLCEVIFRESLKDAWEKIKDLYGESLIEQQKRASFEMEALEKQNEVKLEAEKNERLKHEISALAKSLEEKEKVTADVSAALTKEREQLELAYRELDSLRGDATQQRTLVSESNKELNLVKAELAEALEQIKADTREIQKLNQKLEQTFKDIVAADEQKKMVLALTQERQNNMQLLESKEMELKKQIEAVMYDVQRLLKMLPDFESKVAGKIKANNFRLEDSFSQLNSLLKKAKLLRSTGLIYKQKVEKRCADLQKAEAEVDLLGDEVDTLLNLLEKIYIALDHYSPVLQHYPGIMEILKLIRRELAGESMKPL